MEKTELLFEKYGVKPVLGVIPENKDSELLNYPRKNDFWDKVRVWKNKGWEIAMHGHTHVYDKTCKNEDYFNYGGGSEFFGHTLENQTLKIQKGLEKFSTEKIKIRTFFAPNHTYDKNTFAALKNCGINEVIDGYGLMPYTEHDIKFIPQLFYKIVFLPFGIQSTQLHLNYMNDDDFNKFADFVRKNSKKIITYDYALKKINNNFAYLLLKKILIKILKLKRIIKK